MPSAEPRSAPRAWTDDHLLQRVLAGENAAWKELLRRFRAVVFHCIKRVTSRHGRHLPNADLDEIYAEFLMVLLRDDKRKLRIYDARRGSRLGSWMGMIATNAAHDYLRSGQRRTVLDWFDGSTDIEDEAVGALERMLRMERSRQLHSALPEQDRNFLSLCYAERLSPEQIAQQLNISVKTVYSKKHKVHNKIKNVVAQLEQA